MGFFDFFKAPDVEKMLRNNDIQGLIKALQHNQTTIREQALKALSGLHDERAINAVWDYNKGQAKEKGKMADALAQSAKKAQKEEKQASNDHFLLKCNDCDFTHHIPRVFADTTVMFGVNPSKVQLFCMYGPLTARFTVSLGVKDFFSLTSVPESNQILHASIMKNMKVLHNHMLTHCDPLYLIINQSSSESMHDYKKQAEGGTYVKFSKTNGVDVVGKIDMSKAQIPGVSE